MKKLLGAVLASALAFPSGPASAELLKNLKVGGQLDIQANAARNVTDFQTRGTVAASNDRIGDALTRVLANMQWDLLDDVHATVTLRKNDRTWGTVGGGGQGAGTSQQVIGGAGIGVSGNIYLDQANVKIDKLLGHFDATVGRQYYGDPGDLILYFGPKNNYGLFVTAIDAFRMDSSCDWFNFSGLAGKTVGHAAGVAGLTSDFDVRGFNIGWKNLPVKLNTYVWNQVTHRTGALGSEAGKNDFLWVYGLKVRGEAMGGWASLELAQNGGENRTTLPAPGTPTRSANYTGRAFLADLGYKAEISNVGAFTPWFNFGWGSGRSDLTSRSNEGFTAIASDYRPGIIYGRFDGALAAAGLGSAITGGTVSTPGLNNKVIWGLGLKATPAAWEKLTVGASFWNYRFQRVTGGDNAAGTPGFPVGAVGNRNIGSEFGLTADWKHSDNVSLGIGWASFQPGGYVKNINQVAGVENSPVQFAFADLGIRF
jgi:hypothetical protein